MIRAKPDLRTRNEAAAYLRVSASWLKQSLSSPQGINLGRKVSCRQSDLDTFVEGKASWGSTSNQTASSGSTSSRSGVASAGVARDQPFVLKLPQSHAPEVLRLRRFPRYPKPQKTP